MGMHYFSPYFFEVTDNVMFDRNPVTGAAQSEELAKAVEL